MIIDLSICIVNWNAGDLLLDCLSSVRRSLTEFGYELIVVDNASSDGIVDALDELDLPLKILRNTENRGFAAACNQGAKASDAIYLLFLNPDMQLNENSLDQALAFLQRPNNQHIGIVGIQLVDSSHQVSRACARFPTPSQIFSKMLGLDVLLPRFFPSYFMNEWDHRESREVDHVPGAFYLVRRSLFDALGGFDERFFMYFEDLDFSLRSHRAGCTAYYLADVHAYHKGGGTSERVKSTRLFYSLRSRILYGYKHFGWWTATGLMLGTLLLEPIARIVLAISKRSWTQVEETIQGYALLWRTLPQWITAR